MKLSAAIAVLLIHAAPLSANQRPQQQWPQVIYGLDDRRDFYQVDPVRATLAASTVGLFPASGIRINGEWAQLPLQSYSQRYGLCADEPFFSQPIGAFCSGSLVAPDVIMTAGHCVRSEAEAANAAYVFGYAIHQENAVPSQVPAQDVYRGRLLAIEFTNQADWALIKLDRPVANREPLNINWSGQIANGTPLVVIGHPAGLPVKIADNATVRDASQPGYFVANLDTYGGNSGSAVFNTDTGLIEGILVRGENDYVYRGSCRVSNRCPNEGCRGEDVTKIAAVIPALREHIIQMYGYPQ